jgi:hypothetical protein
MDFRNRFHFHGNASALGGRIVRRADQPIDLVIETKGESSLTPVGGRSNSKIPGRRYEDLVSFSSASTFAEGLFDDHAQAVEATHGRVPEEALTATTRVGADIHDVVVGSGPILRVTRLRATLHSNSPFGSGQPSIRPIDADDQTIIQGVTIDGHELLIELNAPMYQQYDTHAKLLTACDDPAFVEEHGHCLFLRTGVDGRTAPSRGRLVVSQGSIHATIVKKLQWKDTGYPGSSLDHNSVTIPELGHIFFGELLIADRSRRMTMMRLRLGSPVGGHVAFASVEPNGIWS